MKFKQGDFVTVNDGNEKWKGVIDSVLFDGDRCFVKDINPKSEFYGDTFSRNVRQLSYYDKQEDK